MYQSSTGPWLEFFAWDDDGTAKTDLAHNTAGLSIKVQRDNLADSAALSLSAASSPTDYAAGKLNQMSGNKYRVGISTASISSYTGKIAVGGSYTGGTIVGTTEVVSAYNPANNPAVAGDEMALENDALTAAKISADAGAELAALVETYIVNEGDATAVLQAVADKIAADWVAGDASPLAIVAALKADAEWSSLASMQTAIDAIPTAVENRSEMDSNSTQLAALIDTTSYSLAVLTGTISTADSATETFVLTVNSATYTVAIAGLDTDGNRTGQTLSKA